MNVLVTGANGQLGREVVAAILQGGHMVRALVRPAAKIDHLGWDPDKVDVFRADLRVGKDLVSAFEGVDVLVHLAAAVAGGDDVQFASTVVGTERLLAAMAQSQTKALVLASSFSVYDWSEIKRNLTEESPLEADIYTRDGYAISKIWQERLVRRLSEENGWQLCVLRPGFIWGRDSGLVSGAGQSAGRAYVVIGPAARMPLTHVRNCATAFARAAERVLRLGGETFNVVDDHGVRTWQLVGHHLRKTGTRSIRIPLPYAIGIGIARTIAFVTRHVTRGPGKLPNMLRPQSFEARFKPLRHDCTRLKVLLGDTKPLDFEECLRLTYDRDTTAREPGPR